MKPRCSPTRKTSRYSSTAVHGHTALCRHYWKTWDVWRKRLPLSAWSVVLLLGIQPLQSSQGSDFGDGRHGSYVLHTNASIEQLYQTLRLPSDPPQYDPLDSKAIPNLRSLTVTNGAVLSAKPWNGASGGRIVLRVQDSLSVASGSSISVTGLGFRGGAPLLTGESYPGTGGGGCGGSYPPQGAVMYSLPAGGGGHGSPGLPGSIWYSSPFGGGTLIGGCGGSSYGSPSLDTLYLGSGGGGGVANYVGGNGGGGIDIGAGQLEVAGTIQANGQAGQGGDMPGGESGGGAGGSILLRVTSAVLGTTNVSAVGGEGALVVGTTFGGGAGGMGRIAIRYASSYTGTTTPPADPLPGTLDYIITDQPDQLWIRRSPMPTADTLRGVTFGDGQFVAVGDAGTVLTSADGATWIRRHQPSNTTLSAVAYGDGQFIAVGGAILASADGETWVPREPGTTALALSSIAYGVGRFVAVGTNGVILTSADGVTWGTQTMTNNSLSSIAFGSGRFVTVGYLIENGMFGPVQFPNMLTSTDAVNWVEYADPNLGANSYSTVAYGNGRFVAFAGGDSLTSNDGVSWLSQPALTNDYSLGVASVAYGTGQFVAVGHNPLLTSTDGARWAQPPSSLPTSGLKCIAYGGGQFVAVGETGAILTSADAATWVNRQMGLSNPLWSVAYGNGQLVAVGNSITVETSPDGVEWTGAQPMTNAVYTLSGIAYGNSQFVAVGTDLGPQGSQDQVILSSSNAVTWVQRWSQPLSVTNWNRSMNGLIDVTYANGLFVAVGALGTIVNSTDGATWIRQQLGTNEDSYLTAVAFGNGLFVAVGLAGTILTSADAQTWTPLQSVAGVDFTGIAYGNGQFVAVGTDSSGYGNMVMSADGVRWIPRLGTPFRFQRLTYGDGRFGAVGLAGAILTSSDGLRWVQGQSGTANDLSGIAYANGHFVAVGAGGTILQSSTISLSATLTSTPGLMTFSLAGPVGLRYTIQTSTGLASWLDVTNFIGIQPTNVLFNLTPSGAERAFYRAFSR